MTTSPPASRARRFDSMIAELSRDCGTPEIELRLAAHDLIAADLSLSPEDVVSLIRRGMAH